MKIEFKMEALRDLDNTIVEFLLECLRAFDQNEDNYMDPKDRHRIYRLAHLLNEYRN
jgi:hypothetical protein